MIRALQAQHATPDAKAVQAAMSTWENLASTFSALIGRNGVLLIISRSLITVRRRYPWLPEHLEVESAGSLFGTLQASYARQSRANAMAANGALLADFLTMVANLIGAGLTAQYLRSIAAGPDPAQGSAPSSQENP